MNTLTTAQVETLRKIVAAGTAGVDHSQKGWKLATITKLRQFGYVRATYYHGHKGSFCMTPVVQDKDFAAERGLVERQWLCVATEKGIGALASHDATPVEVKVTGTCQCCFNTHILTPNNLTRHGWRESGGRQVGEYGRVWHSGSCFGTGYLPFEKSCERTKVWRDHLTNLKVAAETRLSGMVKGMPLPYFNTRVGEHTITPDTRIVIHPTTGTKGYVDYNYEFDSRVYKMQHEVKHLTDCITFLNEKIAAWVAPE